MTKHEQRRLVHRQLAILRHAQEVTDNVSTTYRCHGSSRQCFYKWRNRSDEFGEKGFSDRSSRPHHSPNANDPGVVGKIKYLGQNYHFGPHKISMYLKRYRDIAISPSRVGRVLKRLGMNTPRPLSETDPTSNAGSDARSPSLGNKSGWI